MPKFIRRSLLVVPMAIPVPELVLKVGSDALILDLESLSSEKQKELSQSQIAHAIYSATQGGAEVFIRIRHKSALADLELVVCPGLTGVTLPFEHPEEVQEVSRRLDELEHNRGIPKGSLQIDAEIGTAMGVLNSLDIAQSCPRLSALTVSETSLYQDLHLDPEANLDKDPLRFIKGQIIVNSRAAGIQAQGMSCPLSITMAEADEVQLKQAIRQARDMGFKGAVCPRQSWVKIANEGFRPTQDELTYYMQVKEVFEDSLRRGRASVSLEGRMIDVPVYRRAQVFLEWGESCACRDMEKQKCLASL